MKKNNKTLFVTKILICLVGARLMFDKAILGRITANVAKIGITGICLIGTQRRPMTNGGE